MSLLVTSGDISSKEVIHTRRVLRAGGLKLTYH